MQAQKASSFPDGQPPSAACVPVVFLALCDSAPEHNLLRPQAHVWSATSVAMSPEPGPGVRPASPESSGRDSPIPRRWRNQLGQEEQPTRDKAYRKYAAAVEKTLSLFETALEEWADYISFLNKLLKVLQARPTSITAIPSKATVAKRLSQCLNPALPSGVHQKALEVYNYVFTTIGADGLSRDLPLYLPGLASTLSFASLSVRSPFLHLLETHFLEIDSRSLRPAMKSVILALLPGLEDETSEDFDRTLTLVTRFKKAIRPHDSEQLTENHSSGDAFFWQCFFLASITGQSRRSGALAYLVRYLPILGPVPPTANSDAATLASLLVRCFASGLADDQLLIQRGFLDLLVTHLPLNSSVLQSLVKPTDLEFLLKCAAGVVTRRDMSLNRRLWAWLLGPEPVGGEGDHAGDTTTYFEEFGMQPLTKSLLDMIKGASTGNAAERARPYRICLSLMDRWEIGGLVVPQVFLPIVQSVRSFQSQSPAKAEFTEVLRSASVFFDGIESGLIYSELVRLLAQALGPQNTAMADRRDKVSLVSFIIANFNVREEEMVTIHAPLTCLGTLSMLEELGARRAKSDLMDTETTKLSEQALNVVTSLLELVPDRAFPVTQAVSAGTAVRPRATSSVSNTDILKKIETFYVQEQGNIDSIPPPFDPIESGELLLHKAVRYICDPADDSRPSEDLGVRVRIFIHLLLKTPTSYKFNVGKMMSHLNKKLRTDSLLPFSYFSSVLQLATHLYSSERISETQLSELVAPLVRHAWSYLSASDPKYHVEAVRCLWQLQTALTSWDREIEAALSGRTFGVLWSHTLQDSVMLARPVFLILDALLDERTQSCMVVKSWLNSMLGIDRLFLLFVSKLSEMPLLSAVRNKGYGELKMDVKSVQLGEDDDLDLCLYYLRTLHRVLGCTGEVSRVVLASKYLYFSGGQVQIRGSAEEGDMTFQDYFVRVCVECITGEVAPAASGELIERASQLRRYALTILHQFLSSRHAVPVTHLQLDGILYERLAKSVSMPDPYVQVLLLDVIYDSLRLQEMTQAERPTSSISERVASGTERQRAGRPSTSISDSSPGSPLMPPQLLKCLQAGLSSGSSHWVLDNWISFLGDCLPFFAHSIFQALIPLVETLCRQIDTTLFNLRATFQMKSHQERGGGGAPESTLFYLLNGLERILALAHDQLLTEEARARVMKGPEQPQSLFGSMVSGVFQSDSAQSRSATANDRLTVHLAFQDTMRTCYKIWSWGQGDEAKKQDPVSWASFNYTSLRMRNRARRLLEHLFTAETLECLETVIDIWHSSDNAIERAHVFNFLSALDACRPKHCVPALFNAIYSRTNPSALDPSRKSTLTISLQDSDLVVFLVEYARSLEDDAMDEIWQDCMAFLKDLLGNPFPHRQTLPSLLEFAAILGKKVDNTNFGEQRRMRRELGDLFLRLLAALFTTRPMTFAESNGSTERLGKDSTGRRGTLSLSSDGSDDVVSVLASIVPNLPIILLETDRVLSAAATLSTHVIGPALRSRAFPDTVSPNIMRLLHELSRLQNNQKTWRKDVGEAFNDGRFFGTRLELVLDDWLPLLRQWVLSDKEKMAEIVGRISAPTTAGIVFGVGATSARLEADRKTQLNLRRIATLVLASADDAFVTDLQVIFDKLVELLAATSTSSPSSTTRADVFLVVRALVLKTSPVHLAMLWPVVNAEMHAAISSVVAPEHSTAADTYANAAILQACKLLDVLICVAPDDFQLHEWLFITDTIDAVYRSSTYQPVALVDELSEEIGSARPLLLGSRAGGGGDDDRDGVGAALERRDELVAKVLRPFFGQLSIFAFESTYAMGALDREACVRALLGDVFDERTMVRAL
ncbi:protein dopey [Hirsutella rhossiliensis]|uniref:Protein dopey n=1 Tax=Hirsutella rhossiliensis TaxID=111463 RepID=A0A9P8MYC9_9HYPO|nr:protein dopey [Hirsutella rhossiliensis]KAH0963232.1 protein dopey [Hirsutella rhossiliensis]